MLAIEVKVFKETAQCAFDTISNVLCLYLNYVFPISLRLIISAEKIQLQLILNHSFFVLYDTALMWLM